MFFIISKILSFLLAPISWILILLIWMIFSKSKKIKKRLSVITIFVIILFSNNFLYRKLVLSWQAKPITLTKENHYSAGILLGGFAGFDIDKKGYFSESADRFIQAEKLYHQGFIEKIIMTGGSAALLNTEPKEANFVKDELIASGVAANDIVIENNSRNTFENAAFSKKILDSLQLKAPYLLITSAIHIPRATLVFKKAGLSVMPFPSDFRVINAIYSWDEYIIPNLKLLTDWSFILKEMIGIQVYKIMGKA